METSDYVRRVLDLYTSLPGTPSLSTIADHHSAAVLEGQGVEIERVAHALLLGTARRIRRDPALGPLQPVRSLAYFMPVLDEVLSGLPFSKGYVAYLHRIVFEEGKAAEDG